MMKKYKEARVYMVSSDEGYISLKGSDAKELHDTIYEEGFQGQFWYGDMFQFVINLRHVVDIEFILED